MELKIVVDKSQVLLKRKELKAEVTFAGATPSNVDVAKLVAEKFKADPELVVIKRILVRFGSNIADVIAYVYETKEAKAVEPQKRVKTEEAPKAAPAKKK